MGFRGWLAFPSFDARFIVHRLGISGQFEQSHRAGKVRHMLFSVPLKNNPATKHAAWFTDKSPDARQEFSTGHKYAVCFISALFGVFQIVVAYRSNWLRALGIVVNVTINVFLAWRGLVTLQMHATI